MQPMPQDLENQIQKKLKELNEATEAEKKFYAKNAPPSQESADDFFKMAEAFDKTKLIMLELRKLLAEKSKSKDWENSVDVLNHQIEQLQKRLEYWQKRELPPSNL